jgi:ATP-dependent DNA ligase
MALPLPITFAPMEARQVAEIPSGDWQYEPKWDGFRCLVFRDGDEVALQSKSGQPLARYFPELVAAVLALTAKRCVLDGEIIVETDGALDFDQLLQRIHPAKSRVDRLSREHPASLMVFDLLVDERGTSLIDMPLRDRRERLEKFALRFFGRQKSISLSPATIELAVARRWYRDLAGGIDGVIAKPLAVGYISGERVMRKIKKIRSADCVVGGFRYGSKGGQVGSLLLGLYDDAGLLHHVGFTSNIASSTRAALTKRLEKLIEPPGFTGNAPGGPSRWSSARSGEWQPLKPTLVVEVAFDHAAGGRFRHGTKFLRWRPDKAPHLCRMDQLTGARIYKNDRLVHV